MKTNQWRSVVTVAGVALAITATSLYFNVGNPATAQNSLRTPPAEASPALAKAYELSDAFREVSRQTLPAVVSIRTTGKVVKRQMTRRSIPFDDPFFRRFFDDPRFRDFRDQQEGEEREFRTPGGQGSGFIIDPNGIVMTNSHVVDDAEEIIVRLSDGREFKAVDVHNDERSDVAVLKLDVDEQLPFLPLGNDEEMEIGDWVLAFGSPFGLHRSVTQGIISAKGRGLGNSMTQEFLQTDAAINPGNSGGPLVNLRGEVIGINTAISTRSGGYDGVSLAVPVSLAKWVSDQLLTRGEVRRAYVGIAMQSVNADLARAFDLEVPHGVAVTSIVKDSPADKAGFREGDVILQVDGRPITTLRKMHGVVEKLNIGQQYVIRILRDGEEQDLKITVAERPANLGELPPTEGGLSPENEQSADVEQIGISIQNLTEELAEQLGMPSGQGVVITSVKRNSPASRVGLEPGMVITRVGQRSIATTEEAEAAFLQANGSNQVLLLVKVFKGRSSGSRFVTVPLAGQK